MGSGGNRGAICRLSRYEAGCGKEDIFGSCLALKYFVQSAAYQELFLAQCDIATPELHMKWNC